MEIKSKSELLMGKKENNDVFKGKDGYLIQKFKKPDDEDINKKMTAINNFLKGTDNVNKYFMLVPNSSEILKDKLPLDAQVESELSFINQIKNNLNKDVKFIDVYNTLYSKGGFKDIYPDSIKLYVPKDKENYNIEYSDSKEEYDTLYSMDSLSKKDKYAVFFEGNHPFVKITTGVKNNK